MVSIWVRLQTGAVKDEREREYTNWICLLKNGFSKIGIKV